MKQFSLEPLVKFLSRLSVREKYILYAAVSFVSLTLVDRLIVVPISQKLRTLKSQIEKTEQRVREDLHVLAQKDAIEKDKAKNAAFLIGGKSEEEQITSILKEIEILASASSVYLIDMKPAGSKAVASSTKYMVNVNCEAEMSKIVDFMYSLENSSKLLTIERFQVNPKSRDSSTAKCSITIAKIIFL